MGRTKQHNTAQHKQSESNVAKHQNKQQAPHNIHNKHLTLTYKSYMIHDKLKLTAITNYFKKKKNSKRRASSKKKLPPPILARL